jgi:hypothetical protein
MYARIAVGLVLLFTAPGAFGGDLRPNEMIVGGGSCEADGLWVSGPSIYLRRGSPGVAVGMARSPGAGRACAYVLVIKGDEQRKVLAEYASRSEVVGSTAHSRGFVAIGNRRAAFEYRVEIDPTGKRAPVEALSINGKALDVGKGRVVLIDLSAADVSWKQVWVGLPGFPAYPEGTAQVESQAEELLGRLRRDSAEVRGFLK